MFNTLILVGVCIFFIIITWSTAEPFQASKSLADYFGAEQAGIIQTTSSITASWIGVTSLIALSGWTSEYGILSALYLLMPGLFLILLGTVGTSRFIQQDQKSLGIEDYFDEHSIQLSVLGFLFIIYVLVLGAQVVGFAKVARSLGLSYLSGITLAGATLVIYVSYGGFSAVRVTDLIQFIFIGVVIATLLIIPRPESPALTVQLFADSLSKIPTSLLSLFLIIGFMMLVAQENHQRIKYAKKEARNISCIFSGLLIMAAGIAIVFVSMNPGEMENPLLGYLNTPNPIYKSMLSIGILAAALSTSDTALVITSYSLSKLIKNNINYSLSLATGTISVILGLLIAIYVPNIPLIIRIGLNLYIGILFPLMMAKFYNFSRPLILTLSILALIMFPLISYFIIVDAGVVTLPVLALILVSTTVLQKGT